jgi:hypothetical protein
MSSLPKLFSVILFVGSLFLASHFLRSNRDAKYTLHGAVTEIGTCFESGCTIRISNGYIKKTYSSLVTGSLVKCDEKLCVSE